MPSLGFLVKLLASALLFSVVYKTLEGSESHDDENWKENTAIASRRQNETILSEEIIEQLQFFSTEEEESAYESPDGVEVMQIETADFLLEDNILLQRPPEYRILRPKSTGTESKGKGGRNRLIIKRSGKGGSLSSTKAPSQGSKGSKKSSSGKGGKGSDPCEGKASKSSKKSGKGKGESLSLNSSKSSKSSGKGKGKGSSSRDDDCDEEDEISPTAGPTAGPTGPTFECGEEVTEDTIDIVIAVDESRSMGPEQSAIRANVNLLFNTIALETNGNFRIGLVGYTGPNIRIDGTDIPVTVDPELKTALTDDTQVFVDAVDQLNDLKSPRENGRGVILRIAQDQVQDLSGTVQPLGGNGDSFPTSRGFCGVIITDERNEAYDEFQDPGNDAVIAELAKTDSALFIVGVDNDSSYMDLAMATGGSFTSVDEFLVNPGPTFEAIISRCIARLCSPGVVI